MSIPAWKIYHGALTAVNAPEGDCATATFSAYGHASWDVTALYTATGIKAANLLSCDVKNKLPLVGDPCDIRVGPDGKVYLMLLTHQLPFRDCPP